MVSTAIEIPECHRHLNLPVASLVTWEGHPTWSVKLPMHDGEGANNGERIERWYQVPCRRMMFTFFDDYTEASAVYRGEYRYRYGYPQEDTFRLVRIGRHGADDVTVWEETYGPGVNGCTGFDELTEQYGIAAFRDVFGYSPDEHPIGEEIK